MAPVSQHQSAQTHHTVLRETEGGESEEKTLRPSLEHISLDALLQEAQQEIVRFPGADSGRPRPPKKWDAYQKGTTR